MTDTATRPQSDVQAMAAALNRAANEGRNVLPDATDEQAAQIEAWALAALREEAAS